MQSLNQNLREEGDEREFVEKVSNHKQLDVEDDLRNHGENGLVGEKVTQSIDQQKHRSQRNLKTYAKIIRQMF